VTDERRHEKLKVCLKVFMEVTTFVEAGRGQAIPKVSGKIHQL